MTQIAISPGMVVRILCRLQFELRDCWIGGFWQRGYLRRSAGHSERAPMEDRR
ncbi:MAG: hypothetical protein WBP81_11625 [Solirubrobacteraceae bacterium]